MSDQKDKVLGNIKKKKKRKPLKKKKQKGKDNTSKSNSNGNDNSNVRSDVNDDVNVDVENDVNRDVNVETGINDVITSKTKREKMKRTHYFYQEEIDFIDEIADKTGRDKSEIVRKAIRLLKEKVEKVNR